VRVGARLALLLALAPAPLSAQAWYTIGAGAGGNRVSCQDCESIERFWSGSGYLRAGGTVGDHVRVGGELVFWQKSIEGSDAYLRAIEGVVLWHPVSARRLLRAGGARPGPNPERLHHGRDHGSRVGDRAQRDGGVGYDLRVGKRVFRTPSVMSVAVPTATIDTPAGPLDNVVATLFFAGLGVTIR